MSLKIVLMSAILYNRPTKRLEIYDVCLTNFTNKINQKLLLIINFELYNIFILLLFLIQIIIVFHIFWYSDSIKLIN